MDVLTRDLVKYIRDFTTMFANAHGRDPGDSWYGLLAQKGSVYEGAPQDHGFSRGVPKQCFSNALHLALEHHLLYAEGYAASPKLAIPIEHAWCVTPDGEVVDTTWSYPDAVYYGLVFSPVKAGKIVRELGVYGIGSSLYRDRTGEVWSYIKEDYA